jgi:hypothetical protein
MGLHGLLRGQLYFLALSCNKQTNIYIYMCVCVCVCVRACMHICVYTDQGVGGNAECAHIHGVRSQVGLPASGAALKPSDVVPWFGRE